MLRQLTFKCKININHVSYLHWIHTSHTKHTVLDLSNVCSNHAPLNYTGQESENNLQFMIHTYLWPWNKVKSSNLVWIVRPQSRLWSSKVWKSFLKQCPPKSQCQSFCQIRKHVNYLPWIRAKVKTSGIFIIYLTYSTIIQSFNLTG